MKENLRNTLLMYKNQEGELGRKERRIERDLLRKEPEISYPL